VSTLVEPPLNHPQSEHKEALKSHKHATHDLKVIRRNGMVTEFTPSKISVAITKAFLEVEGSNATASQRIHERVENLTDQVIHALTRTPVLNNTLHIEDIQDQVELMLMRAGEHKVARAYVLYREQRKLEREKNQEPTAETVINITNAEGNLVPLDVAKLEQLVLESCSGLSDVQADKIVTLACKKLFEGMREADVAQSLIMTARTLIDKEPNYSRVTARLLLDKLRHEALGLLGLEAVDTQAVMSKIYADYFKAYIQKGIDIEVLDPRLKQYDLELLGKAILPERDLNFTYLGLQTLYDRYFLHTEDGVRFELPQAFFMRVAMGLAMNEIDREQKTIEFYTLLSCFDFMSSTPTLFNSGTLHPQLSSCYLTTVPDELDGIYSAIKDNAMLSKFAGGLGNDWTRVRGMGAHIKGTNGKSQGVVPFLKVSNDTAVAVNQGGKRKGAVCAYLETWHIDIEDFLDLRKNTGDERRRTHDMNTANWVPDLFMQRVAEDKDWTLFSPEEVPDLHDLYGKDFTTAYEAYEAKSATGEIKNSRTVKAVNLWRKMLGMLFETGHPWIAFKDPCNLRYTNQHVGVVHSSNLCTEITLHTNDREIAVCNLGSINLPQHTNEHGIDMEKLEATVTTAMRMLDNVIEYNYYSVPQARNANLKHRPVGLGIMGFQDALYKLALPYGSMQAVEFADTSMEAVSYFAIKASSDLAVERGAYSSYEGSLWSQGILPLDTLTIMGEHRGDYLQADTSNTLDWDSLREKVKRDRMRNSNTMAIAPTATISNICGVSQSIEPTYQNMYVKSNLSGEFTVVNPYLVAELKTKGLWDEVMINDLKYFDGSLANIDRIDEDTKARYATAFEVDAGWLVEAAARRQKWIDQAQSLNIYMAEPSGKKLDNIYKLAWVRGLKTTYYLRSKGATAVEKTTDQEPPKTCSILDPDCEACQ
jgi:ribonucleoside-diphosphate reductase alpha chain